MPGVDRSLLFVLALACASLAGCSSQPEPVPLPVDPPPGRFTATGSVRLPERWWTAFEDVRLDAVVDSALASNLDLAAAWQRLEAAGAVVIRAGGARYPTLDAYGRAEASDGSDAPERSEDFELGLTSEYELDLWGRIGSRVEAERYRARASLADYQTAALSLSAEIVLTWYRLAEAHAQLALVEEQIETNETVLELLENRFGTGLIRSVDILRQRQLVAARREARGYAQSRIAVLEHQLAVLLGRSPTGGVEVSPEGLPSLPPLPETGVPIELVRRRPDVRRAFDLVRAADRDVASAISAQYPRLTLSVSAATIAAQAENLFEEWVSSFVGSLLAPIFRGGELGAEVDRTEAVKRQRLYEYGQRVLVAFREVEDALVLEANQTRSIERIEEQVELAREAYERLRTEYFNGASNYLDVLTALDEVQSLRRDGLAARLILVEYRIGLYRALAGSFPTTREDAE